MPPILFRRTSARLMLALACSGLKSRPHLPPQAPRAWLQSDQSVGSPAPLCLPSGSPLPGTPPSHAQASDSAQASPTSRTPSQIATRTPSPTHSLQEHVQPTSGLESDRGLPKPGVDPQAGKGSVWHGLGLKLGGESSSLTPGLALSRPQADGTNRSRDKAGRRAATGFKHSPGLQAGPSEARAPGGGMTVPTCSAGSGTSRAPGLACRRVLSSPPGPGQDNSLPPAGSAGSGSSANRKRGGVHRFGSAVSQPPSLLQPKATRHPPDQGPGTAGRSELRLPSGGAADGATAVPLPWSTSLGTGAFSRPQAHPLNNGNKNPLACLKAPEWDKDVRVECKNEYCTPAGDVPGQDRTGPLVLSFFLLVFCHPLLHSWVGKY